MTIFRLNEAREAELSQMARECGSCEPEEVVSAAFELLQWALRTVKAGKRVASYDESKDHVEVINMDIFLKAKAGAAATTTRQ